MVRGGSPGCVGAAGRLWSGVNGLEWTSARDQPARLRTACRPHPPRVGSRSLGLHAEQDQCALGVAVHPSGRRRDVGVAGQAQQPDRGVVQRGANLRAVAGPGLAGVLVVIPISG